MKKKAKKKAELLEKQLQQLEELEENLQINGNEPVRLFFPIKSWPCGDGKDGRRKTKPTDLC